MEDGTQNGNQEIDIAELMAKIRETAEQRKSHSLVDASATLYALLKANGDSTLSHDDFVEAPPASALPSIRLQPEFASQQNYSVNDLLAYHDHIFVRNAYRAILEREPDEAGFARYLESLRSGRVNKLDVLASLRFSQEGQLRNVKVDGLNATARFRKLYRVPIVGYLLELLVGIVRLPVLIKNFRSLESYTAAQDDRLADHINQSVRRLTVAQNDEADRLRAQTDQLRKQFSGQVTDLGEQQRKIADLHHQQLKALFREQRELTEDLNQVKSNISAYIQANDERSKVFVVEHEKQHNKWLELKNYAEGELLERVQATRTELVLQERRLTMLLEEARRRLPERLDNEQLTRIAAEKSQLLEWFYASLGGQFRGTSQEIKARLKFYLPMLSDAGITKDILDLGCGRGEWLEVLKEAGLPAQGIDANQLAVTECTGKGLQAMAADAISYLGQLDDNSLNCVSAFHVVEHLPLEDLISLFDEILRALRPGGLLMLETPNPENVLVGSCSFYLDPTHRNPIPSDTLRFMVESRGFCRPEVFKLHPVTSKQLRGNDELTQRFNEFFFGPQDYAVIARKASD
jgi:2-polyprenyl-3-methyl-5-hydroxy-6-metoxy-1,4-benzoquinol methylase